MTNTADRHGSFEGARVALLEARMAEETAAMVRRLGGVPVTAPALREKTLEADAEVAPFLDRLRVNPDQIVVLLTGVAVVRLFAAAERLGREQDLVAGLSAATVVARGPKPAGALSRRGVTGTRAVPEPFTTNDVIAVLDALPLSGRLVTIVHYGERNEPLVEAAAIRGALIEELLLYEWEVPEDIGPLSQAIDELIEGRIPVLAFTSQVQVRHLLQIAGAGRREPLIAALNEHVLVGAIGPTCAEACRTAGLREVVVPLHPKLGPLLNALVAAYANRS